MKSLRGASLKTLFAVLDEAQHELEQQVKNLVASKPPEPYLSTALNLVLSPTLVGDCTQPSRHRRVPLDQSVTSRGYYQHIPLDERRFWWVLYHPDPEDARYASKAAAARRHLMAKHEPLAIWVVQQRLSAWDDDVIGEARAALADAMNRYDPDLGLQFPTWGVTWVWGKVRNHLARQTRYRKQVSLFDDLMRPTGVADGSYYEEQIDADLRDVPAPDPFASALGESAIQAFLQEAIAILAPEEVWLLKHRMLLRESLQTIQETTGLAPAALKENLEHVRKKLYPIAERVGIL